MTSALADRVGQVFDEGGPLAGAFAGYEARPGQRRLAMATARIFESGGTLVAEAGTGIGKTLAYLVAAALSGRPVLVSTGARTLQDQIFYKDLPALAHALGREISTAYMKGRTNYLCLHRFDRLHEAETALAPSDRAWIARIGEWAAHTDTGDRGELEDMADDSPLWPDLTATSDQCLGRECGRYADCFITRMRDRAAAADIVVVNHHLLCADAAVRQGDFGEVIPHCAIAVIDEAHQLEDIVTQYFGVAISAFRVDELVRDAARAAAAAPPEAGAWAVSIARLSADVQTAARRLFDMVRFEHSGLERPADRAPLTPEMAGRLHDVRQGLDDALDRLVRGVTEHGAAADDLAAIRTRAEALRADLRILTSVDDPRYVHFIEIRGRGVSLRAAPIDASAIIRESVLGGRHATLLTSATLTVEKSFAYVLERFGLPDAETLRLPSEFDYRAQAILYLPAGMPDPRSREFNAAAAEAIALLLERSRGRAFVLFTSYAAMRDVHQRLEARVRWPLFVQGTAPRLALLRNFRATPHAVLLATSSFWQGIDVAGDALSCVIIDRLPFAVPADPVVAARIAAVTARGGRPFDEYQVPQAALTLLQGLGRLIRTRSDRGVLAVLDPRLTRAAYGRRFLASLPPAPITDDLDVVARFFEPAGASPAIEPGVN